MSTQYPGGIISKTPPTTSGTPYTGVATGIWTLEQALQAKKAGNWPKGLTVPDAPTIGTATGGDAQASVAFTAPADTGGTAITGYTVTSSPGSLTGTGASSPIVVTGLTNGTAYTFTVTATNAQGTGPASAASNSVTPAVASWVRILNVAGDSSTSGTVSVSGYSEVLIFGVAPGGSGGTCGDDDGGGGGGGGAVQLSGYLLSVPGGVTTLYYSTPNPAANPAFAEPGVYQSNLQVRSTNSGGTLLFDLNAGQNGGSHNANNSTPGSGGAGGATGTYGSAAGTAGGIGSIRQSPTTARTAGTNNANGASGAGGGGAWLGTNTGADGGSSASLSVTVSTYSSVSLDISLTAAGVAGGAGGAGYSSPTNGGSVASANGGTLGGIYCGGGGAGGGVKFFGTGNYYGAGGGGGGGQGGTGGKGGAAYLVIYGK